MSTSQISSAFNQFMSSKEKLTSPAAAFTALLYRSDTHLYATSIKSLILINRGAVTGFTVDIQLNTEIVLSDKFHEITSASLDSQVTISASDTHIFNLPTENISQYKQCLSDSIANALLDKQPTNNIHPKAHETSLTGLTHPLKMNTHKSIHSRKKAIAMYLW